ncbi:hypothetical protein J6590_006624 [Homalodisca vitripennis]|nr:hypothetical protein J6590_006624 [Homalodisca vitripennis]
MLLASSTAEVCASQQPVDHPSLLAGPDVVGLIYSCSLCFTTARRSSITTGRPGCYAVCESQQPVDHPSLSAGRDVVGLIYSCSLCFTTARRPSITIGRPGCCWPHLQLQSVIHNSPMLLASSTAAVCASQHTVDHPSLLAGPDAFGHIELPHFGKSASTQLLYNGMQTSLP